MADWQQRLSSPAATAALVEVLGADEVHLHNLQSAEVGAVALDQHGIRWSKSDDGWYRPGRARALSSLELRQLHGRLEQ